jgi:hypothetical protein
VADFSPKMVFLGFGKYARADKIYALEPLRGDERGGGSRTRVWVEGVPEPIIAGRTERSILASMGVTDERASEMLDEALALGAAGSTYLTCRVARATCSSRRPARASSCSDQGLSPQGAVPSRFEARRRCAGRRRTRTLRHGRRSGSRGRSSRR